MLNTDAMAETLNVVEYEALVRETCKCAVKEPFSTYQLLDRYAYINGFAGSGVALLAGNIGYSRELFKDMSCEVDTLSDRGMQIASKVFSATIDEHEDRAHKKVPHRVLAQVMLNSVARYAELNKHTDIWNRISKKPKSILEVVNDFKRDYQGEEKNLKALVRGIGYHIASEFFADREYQLKDEEVWFNHPDDTFRKVVKRGKRKSGPWYGPWTWITTHGHFGASEEDEGHGVEHDHWLDAVEAAELATRFRPREISEHQMDDWLLEGMHNFKTTWMQFFTLLLDDLEQNNRAHVA